MSDRRRPHVHVDADGIRTTRWPRAVRPGVWLLVAGLIALGIVLLVGARRWSSEASSESPQRAANPPRRDGGSTLGVSRQTDLRPPERARLPARAEGDAVLPEVDAAAETDDASTDEPTGIALFPPPGTDPIKRGIIVPDDFELPPGYLRHYQVTDDGKPLPPILLYHPDFQPVDEHGKAIPLPADRVVPPEMAPPGLRIQMLEVPESPIPMIEEGEEGTASAPDPEP